MIAVLTELERDIIFGLHETEGIGWRTIARIRRASIPLAELPGCSERQLTGAGIPGNKAKLVAAGCRAAFIEQRKTLYARQQIDILTRGDERYPHWLQHSAKPPWVLYMKGNAELLRAPHVGIVGTRLPTVYGKRTARKLAHELSLQGISVISGFARGIDSEAHEGALGGKGGTIAVLGTAPDVIYPVENSGLMRQLLDKGGLAVTEYPLGTHSRPGLFPQRNRIIAGLSIGLVVVEADERSGSLITAAQALDENREVFAVPGPISSPKSKGTHKLIQEGAKLVACIGDIVEEIAAHLPKHAACAPTATTNETEHNERNTMNADERYVLSLLGDEPLDMDQLLGRSQLEIGRLHGALLCLLIKKKIVEHAGSAYTLSV